MDQLKVSPNGIITIIAWVADINTSNSSQFQLHSPQIHLQLPSLRRRHLVPSTQFRYSVTNITLLYKPTDK